MLVHVAYCEQAFLSIEVAFQLLQLDEAETMPEKLNMYL